MAAKGGIEIEAPSATDLVLDLLFAHPRQALPVQALARAAEVMDIATPAVRVALTRLQRQGRVAKVGRGSYAVRAEGNPAHHEVQYWFDKESRLRDWKGDWLVVHDAAVPRSAKTLWRRHQRALELYGFRALDAALWVRPDNLDGGAPAMESALRRLGLAQGALVFSGRQFDAASTARMARLWNVSAILVGYRQAQALLARSSAKLARMSAEAAARETMLVGRAVIRAIVRDPLLPEAILPGEQRRALIDATRAYQDRALAIWQDLLQA